ncbi:extracellular solute-binding protein [Hansschlegelia plantiphila]|uniref:extracellular solute-binding protein n=1 Tax=Hansschlegelia plantiphila TaxID=374655 RepID=UPI0022F24DF9|nr:extracellular solute-binding protein [Hansschlegelia plantiphila]
MKNCDRRRFLLAGAGLVGVASARGISPLRAAENETLTLYNGQHAETTAAIVEAFTRETGVRVAIRRGNSAQLANQILEEGDASPADVFYSEEIAPVLTLAARGLLSTANPDTLKQIPPQFAAKDGAWIGVSARCRVVAYNTDMIKLEALPSTVMDFAKPEWRDKVGFVPTSGEFQAQTLTIVKMKGRDAAVAWLKGLKDNGRIYNGNVAAVQGVQRGEVPVALVNNYYWFRVAEEIGDDKMKCQLYYIGHKDPGALLTLSPAGILKSSKRQDIAQRFLGFLVSAAGQQALVDAVAEYPVRPGVTSPYALKPIDELDPPDITPEDIGDADLARALRREAGLA